MSALPTVAYTGMTHLGLCSAVASACRGFRTIAFDPGSTLIDNLEEGKLGFSEPRLAEMLRDNRSRVEFVHDPAALSRCDLVYIAPDVPTDAEGSSDLGGLEELLRVVAAHARADATIVIMSQVPPGFTRAHQTQNRELYYQVETLVLGRAVERAVNPERFIVGCLDPDRPLPLPWLTYLTKFGCPILPMRLESAEMAKIAVNCYLAASVTVTNTLAEICERTGADWSDIAPALRLDRRIGADAYLTPGFGLSGGHLERDLATALRLSDTLGTEAGAIRAFVANSNYRRDWALRILHQTILSKSGSLRLGVLGLAYKENTDSVKNSPAIALINNLPCGHIRVFDPVVGPRAVLREVIGCNSALDAADQVDAIAIMTPWPEFRELSCRELARKMRGRLVLDPFRMLDAAEARAAALEHRVLGA